MLYLRARYYAPPHGLFLTRDPHEGVRERLASRNGYAYVEGNPTNWVDLSGLIAERLVCRTQMQTVEQSDCERFASKVASIIEESRSRGLNPAYTMGLLYGYFSGGRVTFDVAGHTLAVPHAMPYFMVVPIVLNGGPPVDPEFARLIGDRFFPNDGNVYNVFSPDPHIRAEAESAALKYGFKRHFYHNTHHYMANLYMTFFYGEWVGNLTNELREIVSFRNTASTEKLTHTDPNYKQLYIDSLSDILVGDTAVSHASRLRHGASLEALPAMILSDICADTVSGIYSQWELNSPRLKGLFDSHGILAPVGLFE